MENPEGTKFDPNVDHRDAQLYLEYMPLSSMKPAKRNPKRHQIDTVFESMKRFSYVCPMILDERTKRLVAGHGPLKSLLKAKAEGKEPPKKSESRMAIG